MARVTVTALLFLAIATDLTGQQSGTANRDYTINSVGSMAASYVTHNVGTPGLITNSYSTLDPGAPVIWAYATTGVIGWFTTATNSVDIGPVGLAFIADGTNIFVQNPLNLFAVTNGTGNFAINVGTHGALNNTSHYLAMGHAAATSPDGFWVSQTHLVTFITDPGACTTSGTVLPLTDDSFSQQAFGFGFPFYGTVYPNCFVGSNGFVTFVAGNTTFTESLSLFLSGSPRIAEFWDDLNPGTGGQVTFATNNSNIWEVCFLNVPEFVAVGSNSFRVKGVAGSFIEMGYNANMTANDCLCGLSPGTNIDPVGLPLNLNGGPNTIGMNQAPYELFTSGFDLKGVLITWVTDANGNPVGEF